MRVPVQIISFSCFLFSVTVVRGQEITCKVPRDDNLYDPHIYFSGDRRLEAEKRYYCKDGNKLIEGLATCTRDGWTPQPLCPEITCEVPRDQNVYNPHAYFRRDRNLGEQISYSCISGYESKAAVATCTPDGWTPNPLCAEITCEVPRDQNVYDPHVYFSGDRRLEAEKRYYCKDGNKLIEGLATCTRDGWIPNPLCAAKQKLCPDLSVENGFMYNISSNDREIFYSCDTGYKPFSGNWWDSVTCSRGSWSEVPRCIREEECGAFPTVHHGKLKIIRHNQGTAELECDPGFKPTKRFITCVSGTWETPVCEEATCSLNTTDEDLIMKRSPDRQGPVKPRDKLIFSCREGLKLKGAREITCQSDGEWSSPFPTCEEVMCVAKLTVNMRSDRHLGPEVSVRPGDTITLSCVGSEVKLEGDRRITCLNGQWNPPFPKCVGGKCGPPPHVNFADTVEMTKNEYDSGERVEYICFNKYTLDQSPPYSTYMTCEDKEWRGNVKCLKPCSVSVELMDERGIALRWGEHRKIFSPHGDEIEFRCQRGKSSIGLRQKCNDGEMNLPRCV